MVDELPLPPIPFGEVTLTFAADLSSIQVTGPAGFGEPAEFETTAGELRRWLRCDDRGRYRPLPGALTMRTNWQAVVYDTLAAVAEAIYPLAAGHQALAEDGALPLVTLDAVLRRQTGRYRVAAKLGDQGREVASRVLCGQCVKQPLWAGEPWDSQSIPCPEPCSVLVSLCREAATWEHEPPPPAPFDPSVPYAAFEQPGNEIREVYLRASHGEPNG